MCLWNSHLHFFMRFLLQVKWFMMSGKKNADKSKSLKPVANPGLVFSCRPLLRLLWENNTIVVPEWQIFTIYHHYAVKNGSEHEIYSAASNCAERIILVLKRNMVLWGFQTPIFYSILSLKLNILSSNIVLDIVNRDSNTKHKYVITLIVTPSILVSIFRPLRRYT